MTNRGRTIRLFLVDGTPTGLLTAEVMNWTGHVIMGKRSRLPDLIRREEVARTGIYLLTGIDPEDPDSPIVYVGESDDVGKRLAHHNKDEDKDYWDNTVVITSKDQNLTKAHARYLEARLIAIISNANRARLANSTAPTPPALPESDRSDMEGFIDQVRLVLPVLGLDILRGRPRIKRDHRPPEALVAGASLEASVSVSSPVFELRSPKRGLRAEAQDVDGEFIVFKGSDANAKWFGPASHSYKTLHEKLKSSGKLIEGKSSGKLVFAEDVTFRSPSAASATIIGRPDNGRTSWRVKGTNQTYADWADARIASVVGKVDAE